MYYCKPTVARTQRPRVRIPLKAGKTPFFGLLRNCLNCDSIAIQLRWSHIHFICIPAVHIIPFCVSFLSRVDELNKLACPQCMGLYSSAGRKLQREYWGLGFESCRSPEKTFFFFGLLSNCSNCDSTAMVTYSFHLYSHTSHHSILYFPVSCFLEKSPKSHHGLLSASRIHLISYSGSDIKHFVQARAIMVISHNWRDACISNLSYFLGCFVASK